MAPGSGIRRHSQASGDKNSSKLKKTRRVDYKKYKGKKTSRKPEDSEGQIWCWECGLEGHLRTKCPEHFKFKPKKLGQSVSDTQNADTNDDSTSGTSETQDPDEAIDTQEGNVSESQYINYLRNPEEFQ